MFDRANVWIIPTLLVGAGLMSAAVLAALRPRRARLTCVESSGVEHVFEYNSWLTGLGEGSVAEVSPSATASARFSRRYMSFVIEDDTGNRRRYFVDRLTGYFRAFDDAERGTVVAAGICTKS